MSVPSLHSRLINKAEAIAKAADLMAERTNDWQVIRAFISNRISDYELNERQEKKLDRYQYIYNHLVSGKYTDMDIIEQLMNKKLYGVSLKQAYEDMSCSRELFNATLNVNKIFEINLQLQINRNLMRKAEEIGDLKAAAAFEKNRAMMLKLLPEEEDRSAEHFEGHLIEAVFDPRLIGAPEVDMKELLEMINSKRKVKINIDSFATDITHEDVNDADQTATL